MADILASTQRPEIPPTLADMAAIPTPVDPIIGRDRELEQIVGLLDLENVRVLSLLGPGGVGKTRLAQEVVRRAGEDFAHGAAFVSLAPVRIADLVPFAVAQTLAVQERGEVSLATLLSEWLEPRHMLLMLDNMEHVVDAAYPWLAGLIATCPRLKILVTSRIALDIAGEQRFRVSPLPVPRDDATERLDENAAVALFAQRARQVRNDFTLDGDAGLAVAAICRRVEGLPLAIELAASRVTAFTPADILSQLTESLASLAGTRRDAPPRLRSMHDAIAWSYDLLSPEEQDLFRGLAVFVGGFSLDAAEGICGDTRSTAADLVTALINHSLVDRVEQAGRSRFHMLETIREFGVAQLAARDELIPARDRHAAYYLHLAEEAGSGLKGPDQVAWLALLDLERGNLREAMDWLTAAKRVPDALEMYTSIEYIFLIHAWFLEARQLLDTWSSDPDVAQATQARARFLIAGTKLAMYMELPEWPVPTLLEALEIARRIGDRRLAMEALAWLSYAYADAGNREGFSAAHDEQLALARELGDARNEATAFDALAMLAMQQGDLRRALAACEASLAVARKAGDLSMIALSTSRMGPLARDLDGDVERARTLLEEARSIRERLGDRRNLPILSVDLAEIELVSGNLDLARSYLLAALALAQHTGMTRAEADIRALLASIAMLQDDPPGALQEIRQALARHQQFEDVRRIAFDLAAVADLALAAGDACGAAGFIGASERLRPDPTSMPLPRAGSPQAVAARVRATLDAETFEHHHATGRSWSLQDAIAAALAYEPGIETPNPTGRGATPGGLSPRELDELRLMAAGLRNQEIADALFVSLRTIATHVTHILTKLGVTSRTAAVAFAIRNGIA